MLRLRIGLIVTLASGLHYTCNFGLDYRKTNRAFIHPLGPQYLTSLGTMCLLYPLS